MAFEQVPGCPFFNPNDCPFSKGGSVRHDKAGLCVRPDDPALLNFHRAFHACHSSSGLSAGLPLEPARFKPTAQADPPLAIAPPPADKIHQHEAKEHCDPVKASPIAEAAPPPKPEIKANKPAENPSQDQRTLAADNASLKVQLSQLQSTVDDLQRQKEEVDAALDAMALQQTRTFQRENELEDQKQKLEDTVQSLQSMLEGMRQDKEMLQQELDHSVQRATALEAEVAQLQEVHAQQEQQLQKFGQTLQEQADLIEQLKKEKAQMAQLQEDCAQQRQKLQKSQQMVQGQTELIEQLKKEKAQMAQLRETNAMQEQKLQKAHNVLQEQAVLIKQLTEEKRQLQDSRKLLQEQVELLKHLGEEKEQLQESRRLLQEQTELLRQLKKEKEELEVQCHQSAGVVGEWQQERERHKQIVEAMQQRLDDQKRRIADLEGTVEEYKPCDPVNLTPLQSSSNQAVMKSSPHPNNGALVQVERERTPNVSSAERGQATTSPDRLNVLRPCDFKGVPLTLGYLMALKAAFRVADVECNGYLDVANLGHYCLQKGLKSVTYGQLMQMIDAADPTGTGIVDFFSFLGIQVYMALNLKARHVNLRDWMAFCNFGEEPCGAPSAHDISLDEAEGPTEVNIRRGSNRVRSTLQQHLANAAMIN